MTQVVSEFLVELSVALHKFGMYPAGHPSLEPSIAAVIARTAPLLRERDRIAFGVARRQLIVDGAATDASQPLLRRLAQVLYTHRVGAVTILGGVTASELAHALRILAKDPQLDVSTQLTRAEGLAECPHLRFQPLSFEGLSFNAGDAGGGPRSRGQNLWMELVQAAMAGTAAEGAVDPALVAHAIEAQHGETYDRAVVTHLLQIAHALQESTGPDAAALQRQIAALMGALNPATLRRLVDMGGRVADRGSFVRDTTSVIAVDAVIDIVKAAADAGGQTISHGLIRLLSKLAAHAEFGYEAARPVADGALRDQVGRVLDDWQLADPNPEAYGRVLEKLATSDMGRHAAAATDHQPDPLRLAQMSLETGETGPRVERAIDHAVERGRAGDLIALLSSAPDQGSHAADALRGRLLVPDTLRSWLQGSSVDFDSLDRLQPFLSAEGYEVLLDALGQAESRATRRKLLDRLVQAPLDLTPRIVARLEDDRWFVVRNMLVLLERMGRPPEGLSVTRWTAHPDVRVRHEAIRLQLSVPGERHLAVRAALEDGHARLVHSGLAAIQQECPPSVTLLVAEIASNPAASDDLRVLAVRALGRSHDVRALVAIMGLVDGGLTLFGRPKLAARSTVMLAALRALATGWRSHPRAAAVLKLAAAANDTEIRRAAQTGAP